MDSLSAKQGQRADRSSALWLFNKAYKVATKFVGIKPHSEVLHAQHAVPVNDRREKRVVDFPLGVLCGEGAVTAGDVPNGCRVTGEERPTFEIGAECIGILL